MGMCTKAVASNRTQKRSTGFEVLVKSAPLLYFAKRVYLQCEAALSMTDEGLRGSEGMKEATEGMRATRSKFAFTEQMLLPSTGCIKLAISHHRGYGHLQ